MKKEIIIVVLLIIICCMGIEIYHLSNTKKEEIVTNGIEEGLEKEEKERNTKEWKIEGEYWDTDIEAGDPPSYLFYGNEVIIEGNAIAYGTFDIVGDTIKIKEVKAFDPEGEEMEVSDEITEIEIIDEKTLKMNKATLKRFEDYEDVKLSGNYSFVDASDAGWSFFEDGRATFGTNLTLDRGEYKTVTQDGIMVHYKQRTTWNLDTGDETTEDIDTYEFFSVSNDRESLYFLNEQTYKRVELIRYGDPIEQ